MQTGGCAGFGKTPNARARRLLSRVLWAGGLVAAGTVACAVTASAAEPNESSEPVSGLLGSLSSAVEPLAGVIDPVTGLTGSLVGDADTLLGSELALTEDLLSEGLVVPDRLADIVEQPLAVATNAVAADSEAAADEAGWATERGAAVAATDRSFDRSRADDPTHDVATDDVAGVQPHGGAAPAFDLMHLLGSVDPLLGSVERIAPPEASLPVFGTLDTATPLGAVTGVVSLLHSDFSSGIQMLDPLTSLLAPLDSIVRAAVPAANLDPLLGVADVAGLLDPAWQEPSHGASATPQALTHPTSTSTAATGGLAYNSRDALPADVVDSQSALTHSSRNAIQDDQSSPQDSRGDLRPSLLMAPVAGITALHAGATGAAISADQAGPSSHALLPEQAVLRARLFSAAAYARGADVKPLREANDPPVSPD